MIPLIKEADINQLDFVFTPVNNSRKWYMELNSMLADESCDQTLTIVFETSSGPRAVATAVESVIENYVKIKGGVIIPLGSIVSIQLQNPIVSAGSNFVREYVFILTIIVIMVITIITLIIVRNF